MAYTNDESGRVKPPSGTDEGPEADPAVADPPYIGTSRAEEEMRRRSGGGGGSRGDDPLDARVARLEAFTEVSRDDLREIRSDLKAIIGKLGTVSTKADLTSWKWQWMAASFAIFAIIVAGLVGGLSWVATLASN